MLNLSFHGQKINFYIFIYVQTDGQLQTIYPGHVRTVELCRSSSRMSWLKSKQHEETKTIAQLGHFSSLQVSLSGTKADFKDALLS